jgi:hypothetical protein
MLSIMEIVLAIKISWWLPSKLWSEGIFKIIFYLCSLACFIMYYHFTRHTWDGKWRFFTKCSIWSGLDTEKPFIANFPLWTWRYKHPSEKYERACYTHFSLYLNLKSKTYQHCRVYLITSVENLQCSINTTNHVGGCNSMSW